MKRASGAGRIAARRPRDLALGLARLCAGRPRASLAALSIALLALAAQLPRLELRTDGAALQPRGDPAVERTREDRRTFDDPDELVLLLSSRPGGPAVASAAGLRRLARTHRSVAALPGVRASGVRSAVSQIDVSTSGVAALGTFLDEVPDDGAGLASLLDRLREQPLTAGLYLAADGRAAVIYAPLEPDRPRREALAELEAWVREHGDGRFVLRLTGPVAAEALLGERVLADLVRLVPIMILVVSALLLLALRTPGGLLVAMAKTLFVLVATAGAMALTRSPITLMTTILPVVLLALCVTDEVHLMTRLQARLRGGCRERRAAGPLEAKDELLSTLDELYRPVAYTSVSTAIGFLSFLGAAIEPMRHFGILAAFGILLAMLMTFSLTPALVALLPGSWLVPRGPVPRRWRTLAGGLGAKHRRAALAAGLLLVVAALPGLSRLSVQDSWIDNFDPASPLVRAARELDARLWGAYRFDVVLSGPPGRFHHPDGAALAAAASRAAATSPLVGGVVTYLEPLDTVAEVLGLEVGASALPVDALEAVVGVATGYGPQAGLERLVTADGRAARLLVVAKDPDYVRGRALAAHLDRALAPLAAAAGVSVHASGDVPVALATVHALVAAQLGSIAWTLVGVGVLLLAVNRGLRMTLVQLVPPAAAAGLVLAGMGYTGMPLGVATSLFTALTIGVGVDLALHLTYAYANQRGAGAAAEDALRVALAGTAAGRRGSTVVLTAGFLVLTLSAFGPNRDLGLLLAAAMLASYLTTCLFVPRLLVP